ncbi:glycosyltransferase family 2 protein [Patescibacteria group bacterium]|nr:glycosyltransferase family 2 protein [Patescibacteria group bacterium]
MALRKNSPDLSIVILAGNEEKMIGDCLKSCLWADQIVLVAANSTDKTVTIAQKIAPQIKIIKTTDQYNKNFSKWRNLGLKAATGNWIFYVDADERITPELKKEIKDIISSNQTQNWYVIPRANYYLGKRVKHGGSYPDYVKRLFQKKYLKKWQGQLHEEPLIEGHPGYLKSDLLHYTHRDLSSMIKKTNSWTDMEAEEIYRLGHPPIVPWRIFRMMLTKFWQRLIVQGMWKDGTVGWISVIFEVFDTFIIYAKVWEKQQSQRQ